MGEVVRRVYPAQVPSEPPPTPPAPGPRAGEARKRAHPAKAGTGERAQDERAHDEQVADGRAQSEPASDQGEPSASAMFETFETFGPLQVERLRKDDGRALILYTRRDDS